MSLTASRRRWLPIFIATRLGAETVEDVLHHALGQLGLRFIGRGVEHQRDGARDRDAVGEPGEAEVRDRGNVDQHFGDHHEQDREHEQLSRTARTAAHARAIAPLVWSAVIPSPLRTRRIARPLIPRERDIQVP